MTAPVRDPAPGDRARDPGHPPGRMPAAPRLAVIASLALACATDPQATSADDTSGEPGTSSTTSTDSTSSTSGDDASTTTPTTGAAESSTGEVIVPPLGPWRVMTFNVMCSSCAPEGFEDWEERVPYTGDTVRRHDPDLIGFQELFNGEEVAQIEAELPDYTTIWFAAADPGDLDYADATIAYRSSMFAEVEHGFYWLSPTPDTPYSNGFASPQLPRLVVWARLRALAEDHEFVFATTHFDNNSPSQELSAPLVLERTAALADELPVIMVGDFNSKPGTPRTRCSPTASTARARASPTPSCSPTSGAPRPTSRPCPPTTPPSASTTCSSPAPRGRAPTGWSTSGATARPSITPPTTLRSPSPSPCPDSAARNGARNPAACRTPAFRGVLARRRPWKRSRTTRSATA
jgi:endonuclease/exonuclease/phosphatase family metal-dependent hydrolase